MISQTAAAVPVRDDRGRGSACAKAVAASTSRGVGTSVTARTPNACAWSGAGWRRGGRPSGVRTMRPKPSTPRSNVRAGDASHLRPKVAAARGHAANILLPPPLCDRPGCHEPPLKSGRHQACYCCPTCRQALRRVLDRERKWRLRGTFQGRRARDQEYQAARARRCADQHDPAHAPPPRASPP